MCDFSSWDVVDWTIMTASLPEGRSVFRDYAIRITSRNNSHLSVNSEMNKLYSPLPVLKYSSAIWSLSEQRL